MEDRPLRSKLIRLAHAKPELRPSILPLLKQGRQFDWGELTLIQRRFLEGRALDLKAANLNVWEAFKVLSKARMVSGEELLTVVRLLDSTMDAVKDIRDEVADTIAMKS